MLTARPPSTVTGSAGLWKDKVPSVSSREVVVIVGGGGVATTLGSVRGSETLVLNDGLARVGGRGQDSSLPLGVSNARAAVPVILPVKDNDVISKNSPAGVFPSAGCNSRRKIDRFSSLHREKNGAQLDEKKNTTRLCTAACNGTYTCGKCYGISTKDAPFAARRRQDPHQPGSSIGHIDADAMCKSYSRKDSTAQPTGCSHDRFDRSYERMGTLTLSSLSVDGVSEHPLKLPPLAVTSRTSTAVHTSKSTKDDDDSRPLSSVHDATAGVVSHSVGKTAAAASTRQDLDRRDTAAMSTTATTTTKTTKTTMTTARPPICRRLTLVGAEIAAANICGIDCGASPRLVTIGEDSSSMLPPPPSPSSSTSGNKAARRCCALGDEDGGDKEEDDYEEEEMDDVVEIWATGTPKRKTTDDRRALFASSPSSLSPSSSLPLPPPPPSLSRLLPSHLRPGIGRIDSADAVAEIWATDSFDPARGRDENVEEEEEEKETRGGAAKAKTVSEAQLDGNDDTRRCSSDDDDTGDGDDDAAEAEADGSYIWSTEEAVVFSAEDGSYERIEVSPRRCHPSGSPSTKVSGETMLWKTAQPPSVCVSGGGLGKNGDKKEEVKSPPSHPSRPPPQRQQPPTPSRPQEGKGAGNGSDGKEEEKRRLKTVRELVAEANQVDWRERARRRLNQKEEAGRRAAEQRLRKEREEYEAERWKFVLAPSPKSQVGRERGDDGGGSQNPTTITSTLRDLLQWTRKDDWRIGLAGKRLTSFGSSSKLRRSSNALSGVSPSHRGSTPKSCGVGGGGGRRYGGNSFGRSHSPPRLRLATSEGGDYGFSGALVESRLQSMAAGNASADEDDLRERGGIYLSSSWSPVREMQSWDGCVADGCSVASQSPSSRGDDDDDGRTLLSAPSMRGCESSLSLEDEERASDRGDDAAAMDADRKKARTARPIRMRRFNVTMIDVVLRHEDSSALLEFPRVLSRYEMSQLASLVLPPALSFHRWTRHYCLARDGDSFDIFLSLVKCNPWSLLVVRTTRGEIFGAYVDSPWERRGLEGGGRGAGAGLAFHGSARACLWRLDRCPSGRGDGVVTAHHWTGAKRYIQLVDVRNRTIAFGGGGKGGDFGLLLEDNFQRGSTAPCETFGNGPLCDSEHFNIVDVECWGFDCGFD